MTFAYVNKAYGINAKRGGLVETASGLKGRITSASQYVNVRLDGKTFSVPFHPDDLKYLPSPAAAIRGRGAAE